MRMDVQLLVPVFLCLYSIYLVVLLPFRRIFFHNVFYFFSFWIFNILVPCYIINLQFLMNIVRSKLFTFVIFSIIQDSLDYI